MADKDTPDRVKTVPRRPFKVTDYETHMAFKRAKIMTEGVGKGDFDTPVNVAIKEYVESMIRSQKNRFIFSGIAPNKEHRLRLVGIIFLIGQNHSLQNATVFRAVYFLDILMGRHRIGDEQLEMVAITCLIISAKIEEVPDRTPKLRKLRGYFTKGSDSTAAVYVRIERYLLQFFKFFIMVPTEVEFFDILAMFAIDDLRHDEDYKRMLAGQLMDCYERICDYHIRIFSALALQDLENDTGVEISYGNESKGSRAVANNIISWGKRALQDLLLVEPPTQSEFTPSLIAATVMLNARVVFGLPTWTDSLSSISTHPAELVWKCYWNFLAPTLNSINAKRYPLQITPMYQTISSDRCNATCILYKGSDFEELRRWGIFSMNGGEENNNEKCGSCVGCVPPKNN